MHKHTDITYRVHLVMFCEYDFNANYFVLDNKFRVSSWEGLILSSRSLLRRREIVPDIKHLTTKYSMVIHHRGEPNIATDHQFF